MLAVLGPDLMAQQLLDLQRLAAAANVEVIDGPARARATLDRLAAPEEPIMLSGRPGTNRHARRARAAQARRKR